MEKIKVKTLSSEFQQIYINLKKNKQENSINKNISSFEKTNLFLLERNKQMISSMSTEEILFISESNKKNYIDDNSEEGKFKLKSKLLEDRIHNALRKSNAKNFKKKVEDLLHKDQMKDTSEINIMNDERFKKFFDVKLLTDKKQSKSNVLMQHNGTNNNSIDNNGYEFEIMQVSNRNKTTKNVLTHKNNQIYKSAGFNDPIKEDLEKENNHDKVNSSSKHQKSYSKEYKNSIVSGDIKYYFIGARNINNYSNGLKSNTNNFKEEDLNNKEISDEVIEEKVGSPSTKFIQSSVNNLVRNKKLSTIFESYRPEFMEVSTKPSLQSLKRKISKKKTNINLYLRYDFDPVEMEKLKKEVEINRKKKKNQRNYLQKHKHQMVFKNLMEKSIDKHILNSDLTNDQLSMFKVNKSPINRNNVLYDKFRQSDTYFSPLNNEFSKFNLVQNYNTTSPKKTGDLVIKKDNTKLKSLKIDKSNDDSNSFSGSKISFDKKRSNLASNINAKGFDKLKENKDDSSNKNDYSFNNNDLVTLSTISPIKQNRNLINNKKYAILHNNMTNTGETLNTSPDNITKESNISNNNKNIKESTSTGNNLLSIINQNITNDKLKTHESTINNSNVNREENEVLKNTTNSKHFNLGFLSTLINDNKDKATKNVEYEVKLPAINAINIQNINNSEKSKENKHVVFLQNEKTRNLNNQKDPPNNKFTVTKCKVLTEKVSEITPRFENQVHIANKTTDTTISSKNGSIANLSSVNHEDKERKIKRYKTKCISTLKAIEDLYSNVITEKTLFLKNKSLIEKEEKDLKLKINFFKNNF